MMMLADVIRAIESGGNARAMRFEPLAFKDWPFSDTMQIIKAKHKCDVDTARMIATTSWGEFQILGENVFSRAMVGYSVNPPDLFAYIGDGGMQERSFASFIKIHLIDYTLQDILADPVKMRTWVSRWNGPGNIDAYSALIRQHATVDSAPHTP